MKALQFYKHATGYKWGILLTAAALAPNFAYGATQESCETEAQSIYKKKAVEVEMTSIAGNLSELEVASARENLHKSLLKERARCLQLAGASRAADAPGTL